MQHESHLIAGKQQILRNPSGARILGTPGAQRLVEDARTSPPRRCAPGVPNLLTRDRPEFINGLLVRTAKRSYKEDRDGCLGFWDPALARMIHETS